MQVKQICRDKDNIPIIVDRHLKGKYPEASLENALEMALMCVRDNAEKRPSMTEMVRALEYLESQKYINPNEDTTTSDDADDSYPSYPTISTGMLKTQPPRKEPEIELAWTPGMLNTQTQGKAPATQPAGVESTSLKGKGKALSYSSTAEF